MHPKHLLTAIVAVFIVSATLLIYGTSCAGHEEPSSQEEVTGDGDNTGTGGQQEGQEGQEGEGSGEGQGEGEQGQEGEGQEGGGEGEGSGEGQGEGEQGQEGEGQEGQTGEGEGQGEGQQGEGEGQGDNEGGEGEGSSEGEQGQEGEGDQGETEEERLARLEAEYHLWNNGCGFGLAPEPKGVPEGYTPKTYSNPVFGKQYMTPDPTVIRVGKYFYVFSTSGCCRILRSEDLVKWTYIGNAFTKEGRPAWLTKKEGDSQLGLWAPDINYINGQYVLYYSLAGTQHGIGRAVSKNIEGPYTDLGKLIVPSTYNTKGVIDQFYFEYESRKYLAWGSFQKIYITELTDDGLYLKKTPTGNTTDLRLIAGKKFEGSLIHKHGDYYYYIGSVGTCCDGYNSTYHLQVARSTSPFGPYLSKTGVFIHGDTAQGTTFLTGTAEYIGPGHNAEIITDDAGDEWLLYHCFQKGVSDSKRLLFLDKIVWTEDGWPTIQGGVPSSSAIAPIFVK